MARLARGMAIGGAVLVAAAFLVSRSGRQAPLDAVGIASRRHGLPFSARMVPTNGIRLHVVSAGPPDGPPVLLLHGYPEFWWGWHEQMARLARAGFRVFAPDQRGYNASDKPAGVEAYRVETLVADLHGLIDQLGYPRVYLAGHDWGGAIGWRLVLAHPERIARLVMFNAPHPLAWEDARRSTSDEHPIDWFRTFFQLPLLPELVGRAGNWGLLTNSLRDTSRPGTFPDADLDLYRYAWDRDDAMHAMINWYRAAFRHPSLVSGDGAVGLPTRIVWGMQDRFFERRMARLTLDHCADANLIELETAGHWLLHEEPERTSAVMIEFFRAPGVADPSAPVR